VLHLSCGFGPGTERRHASRTNDLRSDRSEGGAGTHLEPIPGRVRADVQNGVALRVGNDRNHSGGLQAEKAVGDLRGNGAVGQLHQQVLLGADGVPLRVSNRILDFVVGKDENRSRC